MRSVPRGLAWLAPFRCSTPHLSCPPLCALPCPPALLQLENGFENAETHAKQDVGSMVFNTFIWCQVSASSAQRSAVPAELQGSMRGQLPQQQHHYRRRHRRLLPGNPAPHRAPA